MTTRLQFTPCPECTITDSPALQRDRPSNAPAAGVATAAEGDGLVVAAAPANAPLTFAGAARTPCDPPGAGPARTPTPPPRTRSGVGVLTTLTRYTARLWRWTR